MHTRTKRLHEIMAERGLNAATVAAMLDRKPSTVNMWRCRTGIRVIPDTALQLLEFKLARK